MEATVLGEQESGGGAIGAAAAVLLVARKGREEVFRAVIEKTRRAEESSQ